MQEIQNWETKSFNELSTDDLYGILALRISVFVVEQNCPYHETDGMDQLCKHIFLKDAAGDKVIATCRISPPDTIYEYASIGRVAVEINERKTGLGKQLMQVAIEVAKKQYPNQKIKIAAQQYLEKFYKDFGFYQISESYLWDGIPHIDMLLD